jgi:hypothetical protein
MAFSKFVIVPFFHQTIVFKNIGMIFGEFEDSFETGKEQITVYFVYSYHTTSL